MIPGTTATEAEERKPGKYRELTDNWYNSQLVAIEVQGSLDESSEFLLTRLCKILCKSDRGASEEIDNYLVIIF